MDRLAELLRVRSRLDRRLSVLVRIALWVKFIGLLVLVSIGLLVGFVESWWKCKMTRE
ncbi:hypothetical protein ES708_01948 [subsurface metagenome]|jgi:hypothetical protein